MVASAPPSQISHIAPSIRRRRRAADAVAAQELQPGSLYDLCRALADPTRLRILGLLGEMELAIGEIAQLLGQSQPRVSRHVRLLEEVALVERRREGSWVFVRPSPRPESQSVLGLIGKMPVSERERALNLADRRRLGVIQAERDAATRRYFDAHAEQWDAIRALHVDEGRIELALEALWQDRPLGHLVDIGTGTGRMAALLRSRAERVTGVDRSPEMLRVARSRLQRGSPAVDLVHGDATALPLPSAGADSAVMHHLLHFVANPARALAEIGRILVPGGRYAIIDFASHDVESLRKEAAHVWLGFSNSQIRDWALAAGLQVEGVESLEEGRLTVRIWHGRRTRQRVDSQRLDSAVPEHDSNELREQNL